MSSLVILALLPATLSPQLPDLSPAKIFGARSLALSPDGSRLAFTYQGDIWVSPANGGRAIPLTNHVEMDKDPVWSPDGKVIAFSSNRYGNDEVFLVSAEGGTPRRLTYFSGNDTPTDWSPDGKSVLITGARDSRYSSVFALDVATGKIKRLFQDIVAVGNPRLSADGKSVVYNRLGFPWVRPRYQGSAASQLWRFDLESKKRTALRNNGLQHLWPQIASDGRVLAVAPTELTPSSRPIGKLAIPNTDNVARTPNVIDASGKRYTQFVGPAVRFLTAARNAPVIAFERDGEIYVQNLNGKPEKITVTAAVDDKTTLEERLILTEGATDAALSPKADKVAFVVRGEVWLVPTKKGKGPNADDATQLTDWAGTDGDPFWLPDNKHLLITSDRNGPTRIFKVNTETKEVSPVSTGGDAAGIRLSPDKQSITYWESGVEGGLFSVPVAGGTPKRLFKKGSVYTGGPDESYDISPDGRYVAYSETLTESGFYYWESGRNIIVLDTKTGKSYNVTNLNAQHTVPRFTPDAKALIFNSNRSGNALYILPLQKEDTAPSEVELKYEKPKSVPSVEIDFAGIDERIRRFVNQDAGGNLTYDPSTGELFYVAEGDLWKVGYNGEDAKRLTQGAGIRNFELSADFTQALFLRGGLPTTLNLKQPGAQPAPIKFRADWTRDLRAERRAAFEQFWRSFNRSFYDPAFHGRDWNALKARYVRFLPAVGHREEFATVLNMLVGELESSHAEVGAAPGGVRSQTSAHPGFEFDYDYAGPGIKVGAVPAKVPASYTATKLNVGEVVTKINGKAVSVDEALWRDVLNEQVGRELTFTVKGGDGKEREVKYKALSQGEYRNQIFQNLLLERRKRVEELSGGKLTYVHIAGMSQGEFDRFQQQIWAYGAGKKGVIIDVRNNGGGNTADKIIDILERRPNMRYQVRDEDPIVGPGQVLNVPTVVMMAESSFSNAEMFPAAMKARGLATLVGMPTPGYVIYTYGLPLVDGTSARMPSTGAYRLDGSPLENLGEQPDISVDISPEEFFRGEDPQLKAAIEALLKKIK